MDEQTRITVYAHPFCGMVAPTLATLKRHGAAYTYVDIRQDHAARERVREINHGYESVPTLVFPDGATLTEPSQAALAACLRERGYVPPPSLLGRLLRRLRG